MTVLNCLVIRNRAKIMCLEIMTIFRQEILRPPQLVGVSLIPTERRRRQRGERRRKRAKRAGLWLRLQANPYKPPLPSLFLANSQSLINKID